LVFFMTCPTRNITGPSLPDSRILSTVALLAVEDLVDEGIEIQRGGLGSVAPAEDTLLAGDHLGVSLISIDDLVGDLFAIEERKFPRVHQGDERRELGSVGKVLR
jgi:hypothetical protein